MEFLFVSSDRARRAEHLVADLAGERLDLQVNAVLVNLKLKWNLYIIRLGKIRLA